VKIRVKRYVEMKSPDSITYGKSSSIINTNIEKLVKENFSPGSYNAPYTVVAPNEKARNTKGIVKMIMGIAYFISFVYFLTRLLI
jgi:hypothetical protein